MRFLGLIFLAAAVLNIYMMTQGTATSFALVTPFCLILGPVLLLSGKDE